MRVALRALALLALSAGALGAQVQPKSFSVTTRLGALKPERSASMDASGLVGVDAEYSFKKWLGFGTSVDVAHGNTHREDFLIRLRYGSSLVGGDTIYYQYLGQPVNTINIGAYGVLRVPNDKISPFVVGGVGNYTMLFDTQVNGNAKRLNNLSYIFGGGVWFKVSSSTGVQLDARAIQMQDYDRTLLDPSRGRNKNTTFPEDFPKVPAAKNTALNTMFTIGFRYIPGSSGGN
jgi:hypothetical protein